MSLNSNSTVLNFTVAFHLHSAMADQQTDCCRKPVGSDTCFQNVKITPILGPFKIAEGPHWDKVTNSLYFVDILGKSANVYVPATNFYKKLPLENTVSLIIPVKDAPNKYIIGYGAKLVLLTWDGKTTYHSIEELTTFPNCEEVRLNDGKADHLGNIWLGTMAKEKEEGEDFVKFKGEFYRYGIDGTLETIEKRVSISNGIAWNVKRDLMYYIDSLERRVDVFDYDSETGEACNRRPFFDFKDQNVKGLPDGMTTDCDDNLWVACYGASQVLKISGRTGIVLGLLKFPTELISSVIFGGEEKNIMYVTSISYGLINEQLAEQPLAGYVFQVEGLGVTGADSHPAVMLQSGECITEEESVVNKCEEREQQMNKIDSENQQANECEENNPQMIKDEKKDSPMNKCEEKKSKTNKCEEESCK